MLEAITTVCLAIADPLLGWLLYLPRDLVLAMLALGTSLILIVVLVNVARKRNANVPDATTATTGEVQVATTPPAAASAAASAGTPTGSATVAVPPVGSPTAPPSRVSRARAGVIGTYRPAVADSAG